MSGEELRQGLEGAYALMVNDYEFEMIKNKTGLSTTAIRAMIHLMIVTHGAEGAAIYAGEEVVHTPVVPPMQIIDPTGVGDAFRGGFLTGYSRGLSWEFCGKMGALAATYCLEVKGTQVHSYTIAEFVARFREHFDDGGVLDGLIKEPMQG
jgi:adenosine kinase